MDLMQLSPVLAILAAGAFGFVSQRSGLCMVEAVEQIIDRRPPSIALMMVTAIIASAAGVFLLTNTFSTATLAVLMVNLSAAGLLGGFAFGLGAALNGGCAFSTMNRFARGDLRMLGTLLGLFVGPLLLMDSGATASSETLTISGPGALLLALLCVLAVFAFSLQEPPFESTTGGEPPDTMLKLVLPMLVLGIAGGMLFATHGNWTYLDTLRSTGMALMNSADAPGALRWIVASTAVLGAALAAFLNRTLHLQTPANAWALLRHLLGGSLMGSGAAIVGGGNDEVLLAAIPRGASGALVTATMIVIGIGTGIMIGRVLSARR
jgi:hypothetical protein